MKKCLLIAVLVCFLAGCGAPKSFETLSDEYVQPPQPMARETQLALPEEAAVSAITNGEQGSIYLCDGYTIAVQTMDAGDLDSTVRTISGFSKEKLSMMERQLPDHRRYECVWAAAGEGEDQICRAVILDDGNYHYTVTVAAGASDAGELTQTWQSLLGSFSLRTDP